MMHMFDHITCTLYLIKLRSYHNELKLKEKISDLVGIEGERNTKDDERNRYLCSLCEKPTPIITMNVWLHR